MQRSRFLDDSRREEGPIKMIDLEQVPQEPRAMYEGFDWVTVDINDAAEVIAADLLRLLLISSAQRSPRVIDRSLRGR